MRNKVFFSNLIYLFLFLWWILSSYFSAFSIMVFNIPLWFFLSCILFPILSLLFVCIFVYFFKG
ncbi:DUF997 domain-containing protein [Borrelia turcica IST7]|uniref:DUF997 domain-containing protein n=1 Tax=Borrelia turcica IST7 TaxID=1104446 RepID=A0A386PNM9_9SPIR|nr:DUF997 family protein [Borrelia turcica]AYE36659.1 DUF997 domain-containing protein [Borrelia turcica IST7]